MQKVILALAAIMLLATACPKQPDGQSADTAQVPPPQDTAPPPAEKSPEQQQKDLLARGQEIFTGTAYSKTGLTCATCHSMSQMMDEGKIYIASPAYNIARRVMWRVSSQEQLASGKGDAPFFLDAADMCIKAPYMNNPAGLTEEDKGALQFFFKSIDTRDSSVKAIISNDHYEMPPAGLKPDKEHGKVIYETSCKFCHDNNIQGLPSLKGAKDWLTPIQVMAKVRRVEGDWYNDYKTQVYACADPLARQLALLGINVAYAQEAGALPPAAEPGAAPETADAASAESELFPENAMPGYSPGILSDQDVVDVSFYVAEDM